jgi:hypothetical protein
MHGEAEAQFWINILLDGPPVMWCIQVRVRAHTIMYVCACCNNEDSK